MVNHGTLANRRHKIRTYVPEEPLFTFLLQTPFVPRALTSVRDGRHASNPHRDCPMRVLNYEGKKEHMLYTKPVFFALLFVVLLAGCAVPAPTLTATEPAPMSTSSPTTKAVPTKTPI